MRIDFGKGTILKLIFAGAVGAVICDRVQKHKASKKDFERHKKQILGADTTYRDIVNATAYNKTLNVDQSIVAARYLRHKQMAMYTARNIKEFDKAYFDLYSLIDNLSNHDKAEVAVLVALWEDEMDAAEKRQAELESRRTELEKMQVIASAIRSLARPPQSEGITINLGKEN